MIWGLGEGGGGLRKRSQSTATSLITLLTCTQAIPTPTAPMIFRWSRMNSSSLLMQPPWKKSKASFVVSVDVEVHLWPCACVHTSNKSRARYTHVRTRRCYTNADLDTSVQGVSPVHTFHRSHLHLVDVGRVVPEAAELGGGLAAAVGYQSAFCSGANIDALGPVGGAVAATTLELRGETSVGGTF